MQTSEHISLETLAALAEGRCDPAREEELRGHLASCRVCFSAYADAVRFRAVLLDDPDAFTPADELVRIGDAVAAGIPAAFPGGITEPERIGRGRLLRPHPVAAAAAILAVLFVALLWLPGLLQKAPPLDPATLACIQAAISETSARGMVLPAGQATASGEAPVYRSGSSTLQADLPAAVESLARMYQQIGPSRALSFWLVSGQVAAGQLDNARAYALEARARFPEDARFAALEAIIAYRESDLKRAELLLREVLQRDSTDQAALFNLGFMLEEQGRRAEATRCLRAAERCGPETPLGIRARTLLAAMPER
jgi:hypothetical protein